MVKITNTRHVISRNTNQSFNVSEKDSLCAALFCHQLATSILSNNSNELTGRRQQGGAMLIVRGEVSKHTTTTGANPTGLGR